MRKLRYWFYFFHFSFCSRIQPVPTNKKDKNGKKTPKPNQNKKAATDLKYKGPSGKEIRDSIETVLLKDNARCFTWKAERSWQYLLTCWSLKFTPSKKTYSNKVSNRAQCTPERSTDFPGCSTREGEPGAEGKGKAIRQQGRSASSQGDPSNNLGTAGTRTGSRHTYNIA